MQHSPGMAHRCAIALSLIASLFVTDAFSATTNDPVVVRAKGSLLNNVGPIMHVYVNGVWIDSKEVRNTSYQDFTFKVSGRIPSYSDTSKIDIYFSNDQYANGVDRNLWVQRVGVADVTAYPNAATYDRGVTYAQSTDGVDVLSGREGMAWQGAMRYVLTGLGGTTPPSPPPSTGIKMTPTINGAPRQTFNSYDSVVIQGSPYVALNNLWNTDQTLNRWRQAVGVSPMKADGSVDCRLVFNFAEQALPPDGNEVLSYPECIYGRSNSISSPAGSNPLIPKRVSDIASLKSSYQAISGSFSGMSHVAYDTWVSKKANGSLYCNLGAGVCDRRAELLITTESAFVTAGKYGYGLPASHERAGQGRTASNLGAGRNASKYVERKSIGGIVYDVYNYGGAWNFIVFVPMQVPHRNAFTADWKAILDYTNSKGWTLPSDTLSSIEIGVETTSMGSAGDVTIHGFKVTR